VNCIRYSTAVEEMLLRRVETPVELAENAGDAPHGSAKTRVVAVTGAISCVFGARTSGR
jgi:hypothetical protein